MAVYSLILNDRMGSVYQVDTEVQVTFPAYFENEVIDDTIAFSVKAFEAQEIFLIFTTKGFEKLIGAINAEDYSVYLDYDNKEIYQVETCTHISCPAKFGNEAFQGAVGFEIEYLIGKPDFFALTQKGLKEIFEFYQMLKSK